MADAQRSFERRVDELVLSASPSELAALQEIDAHARASGTSFYDAYLAGAGGASRAPAAGSPPGGGPRRARRAARGGRSPRASEAAAP